MIDIFLQQLEEAYDTRKKSDTGFEPEACVGFRASIQAACLGDIYVYRSISQYIGKVRS